MAPSLRERWPRATKVIRGLAVAMIASLATLIIIGGILWAAYAFRPIPPMFDHRVAVAARSTFAWGMDPIQVRRAFCVDRGRWVELVVEVWSSKGKRIVENRRRPPRYFSEGCQYDNEVDTVSFPTGVVLEPGDYVVKTWARVLPSLSGHLLERATTEALPDVPFTVVWR